MQRYFFNIHDGAESFVDDTGTELSDDKSARQEAIETLAQVARDELPRDGDRTDISVHVTDSDGKPLFAVRIDFHVDAATVSSNSSLFDTT